jgi:iron-sulfur cluster insertion protein
MELHTTPALIAKVTAERARLQNDALYLRLTIEGGGCSGFQYIFAWDATINPEDKIFDGAVTTDPMSLPFLNGATLDYVVGLMGEDFKITNPNASSGCGCGTSFAI